MSQDEEVKDSQRRFSLMKSPKNWPCKLPMSFLAHLAEDERELWIATDQNTQKLDWLIDHSVMLNNHIYHRESDIIRNSEFRKNLKVKIATTVVAAGLAINGLFIFLPKFIDLFQKK